MTQNKAHFSKILAFFRLFRFARTIMVAAVSGTAAFTAGAGISRSMWMTLAGWFLAVGGFSMDFYADRDLDSKAPRTIIRFNPLADGSISPGKGLAFSLTFIAASFVVTFQVAPWALLPWGLILAVITGLALHFFETPLARAFTLGLLQALYILMGGAAGSLSLGLVILAGMLFFAMSGARGIIDIRDFPQDKTTRVQTLPKRFGIKRTVQFSVVSLLISYALCLGAYFTGEFGPIYLYLVLALIAIGMVCTWLFAVRPTPRLARILTPVFMMGEGSLICLAMILGSMEVGI